MTKAWDIIPDVHADITRLETTLNGLDNEATLAFLGDFIDAGKNQAAADDEAVLKRVRKLIEEERAIAVMGNHELNAILYHTLGTDGLALRERSEKNTAQHRSFVEHFGVSTPQANFWVDWFQTLPLWIELDGLRLIHACWNQPDIDLVAERRPDGRLAPSDFPEIGAERTDFAKAVKRLITGPEMKLPEGAHFHDSKGHPRDHVRIAWWRANATSWKEAALSVGNVEQLPSDDLPADREVELYSRSAPPVLVGHYKMTGTPCIETSRAACLDYPATPCAYRWRGETDLQTDNLAIFH